MLGGVLKDRWHSPILLLKFDLLQNLASVSCGTTSQLFLEEIILSGWKGLGPEYLGALGSCSNAESCVKRWSVPGTIPLIFWQRIWKSVSLRMSRTSSLPLSVSFPIGVASCNFCFILHVVYRSFHQLWLGKVIRRALVLIERPSPSDFDLTLTAFSGTVVVRCTNLKCKRVNFCKMSSWRYVLQEEGSFLSLKTAP